MQGEKMGLGDQACNSKINVTDVTVEATDGERNNSNW